MCIERVLGINRYNEVSHNVEIIGIGWISDYLVRMNAEWAEMGCLSFRPALETVRLLLNVSQIGFSIIVNDEEVYGQLTSHALLIVSGKV